MPESVRSLQLVSDRLVEENNSKLTEQTDQLKGIKDVLTDIKKQAAVSQGGGESSSTGQRRATPSSSGGGDSLTSALGQFIGAKTVGRFGIGKSGIAQDVRGKLASGLGINKFKDVRQTAIDKLLASTLPKQTEVAEEVAEKTEEVVETSQATGEGVDKLVMINTEILDSIKGHFDWLVNNEREKRDLALDVDGQQAATATPIGANDNVENAEKPRKGKFNFASILRNLSGFGIAIGALLLLLKKFIPSFKTFKDLFKGIKKFFTPVTKFLKGLGTTLKNQLSKLTGVFKGFFKSDVFKRITGIAGGVVDKAKDLAGKAAGGVKSFASRAFTGIKNFASGAVSTAKSVVSGGAANLLKKFPGLKTVLGLLTKVGGAKAKLAAGLLMGAGAAGIFANKRELIKFLGSLSGGVAGGVLGALAVPGVGGFPGMIAGGIAGEAAAEKMANFLLGEEPTKDTSGTVGANDNVPQAGPAQTGQVQSAPAAHQTSVAVATGSAELAAAQRAVPVIVNNAPVTDASTTNNTVVNNQSGGSTISPRKDQMLGGMYN